MHVEPDNKVWLGLDNGISFVDLSSHNYFFNDISGRLGAVYDVVKFKDTYTLEAILGCFISIAIMHFNLWKALKVKCGT